MIFARNFFYKIPEFYTIFARKMPEFYIVIARKYFFPLGGTCPPPSPTPMPSVSTIIINHHRHEKPMFASVYICSCISTACIYCQVVPSWTDSTITVLGTRDFKVLGEVHLRAW